MKKLLLGTVAVIGLAAVSSPATAADGVSLDLGGFFKGYVTWHDQDETVVATDERQFDIIRATQVYFSGETTLDNGLTVGMHIEADADNGDGFNVEETYAYFSGSWGRFNFGDEDGAAYLLQVAAPSADSNVDGIRQFIGATNYVTASTLTANGTGAVAGRMIADGLDYDNAATDNVDKLTYLSPVINGFQGGLSYTPDVGVGSMTTNMSGRPSRNLATGVNIDDANGSFGEAWEAALRWEGNLDELDVTLGGGYTHVGLEKDNAHANDDFVEWNLGADFDWGAFGLGVVYTENNNGLDTTDDNDTWVVGVDYTTGAFKLGASYLNNETNVDGAAVEVETDRWTGGVVYTYGPGMTFRGSLSYVDHEIQGSADSDATSILLGTQIHF